MKKHQLEHLIRAAGSITGCPEVYVVGSQAILAIVSSGPPELFLSRAWQAGSSVISLPEVNLH